MFFGVSGTLSIVLGLIVVSSTFASVDPDYDYVNEARQCHYKSVENDAFPYPYTYNEWSRYLTQGHRRTPPDFGDRLIPDHLHQQVRAPDLQQIEPRYICSCVDP
jgi:hypothetical protein